MTLSRQVYFFRHGEADWPEWDKPDDERPLTKHGKAKVKRVAKFLRRVGAEPRRIFTSPLPRASQTAKIVAKQFGLQVGVEKMLGKDFSPEKFLRLVEAQDVDSIMIIGHEPDFSRVIRAITGGDVALGKAGVALVELGKPGAKGKLRWLFPPRFTKAR